MKQELLDFLYNLDRAGASLCGAPPEETISSQIGRAAQRGVWWGRVGRAVLNRIQKNHCENAILHADALDRCNDGV